MSAMQSDIITALGVAPTIDPDQEITRRVQFPVSYTHLRAHETN